MASATKSKPKSKKSTTKGRRVRRKPTEMMLKALKRIRIQEGSGDGSIERGMREMCIMQAIAWVTGQAVERDYAHESYQITDHPICVSRLITDCMIYTNDSCSDKERSRLKKLVPEIMGTCPIREIRVKGELVEQQREETDGYRKAERRREKALEGFIRDKRYKSWQGGYVGIDVDEVNVDYSEWFESGDVPFNRKLAAIRAMAAIN